MSASGGQRPDDRDSTRQAHQRDSQAGRHWTFLSNHGHVLVCLAKDPEARLRDVAVAVGITERAVQKIVSDLEAGGVVERVREGRRNHYRLFLDRPMRHPIEAHCSIGELLAMVLNAGALRRLADIQPARQAPATRRA
jgi:DNA-binding transcriptional ArsR family regulator